MSWIIKRWAPFTTALAADLNQFRTNLELLKLHTHDGTAGDGSAAIYGGLDYAQVLPMAPDNNSTWSTITATAAAFGGYLSTNDGVQGRWAEWQLPLRNGTWRIDVLHAKGPDMGIITVTYAGDTWGTVDCYAAGVSVDNSSAITGVTVGNFAAATARALRFTISTKNASATAYYGRVQFFAVRRTGA